MRFIHFYILLTLSSVSYSQDMNVWLYRTDSIEVIVFSNINKEMITVDEQESFTELGRALLTAKEIEKFVQLFNLTKNYHERSAMLTHYNIEFILYQGKMRESFQISSITRTIYHTNEGNIKLDLGYARQIGKKLEKYLIKFLGSHGLLELISENIRFK